MVFLVEDGGKVFLNIAGPMGDEDCLFINVQTPRMRPREALPVMVYIHAGTNIVGSGSGFDASTLCQHEVVFVSFNYRLGVLGNAAFDAAYSESGTVGNYGLQDQRMALDWVQKNIANFGGDPTRVTICGESAGAMAVAAHAGLERSQKLFAQGIMMSGNDDSMPLPKALALGNQFADHVRCKDDDEKKVLECLRSKSAELLINEQLSIFNQSMRALQVPIEDGFELPVGTPLRKLYADGNVPPKPLLAGTCLNDSSIFFALTPREIIRGVATNDLKHSIDRFLEDVGSDDKEKIASLYKPDLFGGVRLALYALGTDGYFECPTRRVLRSFASEQPVYHYIYGARPSSPARALLIPRWVNWLFGVDIIFSLLPPFRWLGAFHTANEYLFWGAADPSSGLKPDERDLGFEMVRLWAKFVHGEKPWTPYGEKEHYKFFDRNSTFEGTQWRSRECDFLGRYQFTWNPLERPAVDKEKKSDLPEDEIAVVV
eukprot:TRINITY_DN32781_c0_g1_i1.p1 TRINITY_DN32781_c0_g1~~TRINITY_DN32781_c0_g1_i1.p1  ORF type:complete len:487 (+),score=84.79 TRINITY_DN32781_c0_g1_i1:169-1629(+)